MRILHVVASLGLRHGGVSVSVRELCLGLAELGHDIEIVTTTRGHDPAVDDAADAALAAAGVRVRYCSPHPSRWRGQRYAYSPVLAAALDAALPGVDLVHLHGLWQHPAAAAAARCRRHNVPYVVSPCGALDPPAFRAHRAFKWCYGWIVERRTLAGAAAVQFTSALEQRRAQLFGTRRPATVIPCPVPALSNPSSAEAFRTGHPEVGSRHIIVFLGRLHAKKRLDLLTEAFIALTRRRDDVHLVVAGPEAGAGLAAQRRLAAAGYADRATFTGLLANDRKAEALLASALFALPSDDENFGVAVAEAMAAGVPVLVSPHVGLAESAAAAGAGVVVDGDAARWAAVMAQLLDEPTVRRAMGDAGRRFAAAAFRRDAVAGLIAAMYARVVTAKASVAR